MFHLPSNYSRLLLIKVLNHIVIRCVPNECGRRHRWCAFRKGCLWCCDRAITFSSKDQMQSQMTCVLVVRIQSTFQKDDYDIEMK